MAWLEKPDGVLLKSCALAYRHGCSCQLGVYRHCVTAIPPRRSVFHISLTAQHSTALPLGMQMKVYIAKPVAHVSYVMTIYSCRFFPSHKETGMRHTHTHTHTRARAHARTHAHTHTHTHLQKMVHTQTGAHTLTPMHTQTGTYTTCLVSCVENNLNHASKLMSHHPVSSNQESFSLM